MSIPDDLAKHAAQRSCVAISDAIDLLPERDTATAAYVSVIAASLVLRRIIVAAVQASDRPRDVADHLTKHFKMAVDLAVEEALVEARHHGRKA